MTREEEIMQEANIRYSVSHPFIDIAKESFIEGAKWADTNLSEEEQVGMGGLGMIWQKQALINKAYKWLKEEFYTTEDRDGYSVVVSSSCNNVEELIEDFRKVIEDFKTI